MPQAATSANRAGSAATKASSVSRSSVVISAERRWTTSAMRAVSPGPRQSGSPMRRRSSTRPIHAAWRSTSIVHHLEQLGLGRVVLVVPRHVVEQDPIAVVPEQPRNGVALEAAEHVALVGEERRHDLEPRGAAARERQPPDAGQVPAAHLLRRPVALDPARCEHLLGPREVAAGAAGPRPAEAERLLVERDVERPEGLGRQRRPGDGRRDLGFPASDTMSDTGLAPCASQAARRARSRVRGQSRRTARSSSGALVAVPRRPAISPANLAFVRGGSGRAARQRKTPTNAVLCRITACPAAGTSRAASSPASRSGRRPS